MTRLGSREYVACINGWPYAFLACRNSGIPLVMLPYDEGMAMLREQCPTCFDAMQTPGAKVTKCLKCRHAAAGPMEQDDDLDNPDDFAVPLSEGWTC